MRSFVSKKIFLIYFIIAFLLRFPFFFLDAIDHDESTFILVGQHLADGFLPYYDLWDLKPPGIFYYFGALLSLFGKKLWLIRLSGVILVTFSAWFCYKISLNFVEKKSAFWAGILCIYLLSVFGTMQGVMSEHIGILPFLLAFYYLLKPLNWKNTIIIGFGFGLAFICRLNLAYPAVVVLFLSYFFEQNFLSLKKKLNYFIIIISGFSVLFLAAFPYFLKNDLHFLYQTVIKASLAYSDADWVAVISTLPSIFIFLSLTFSFIFFNLQKKSFGRNAILLSGVLFGMIFMFLKSGKINGHYLIQIYPFLCVIFVYLIENYFVKIRYQKVQKFITLFFILAASESYFQYFKLIQHQYTTSSWLMGDAFEISDWLEKNHPLEKNLFFMKSHLGYWLTQTQPPTPVVTHPTNVYRETAYLYLKSPRKSPAVELNYIFNDLQPKFIIEKKDYSERNKNPNNPFFGFYKAYQKVYETKNAVILERK